MSSRIALGMPVVSASVTTSGNPSPLKSAEASAARIGYRSIRRAAGRSRQSRHQDPASPPDPQKLRFLTWSECHVGRTTARPWPARDDGCFVMG